MEERKNDFVSYLDDDNTQKDVWVEIIEESNNFIKFIYQNEEITIPWHRILKVKKREVNDD